MLRTSNCYDYRMAVNRWSWLALAGAFCSAAGIAQTQTSPFAYRTADPLSFVGLPPAALPAQHAFRQTAAAGPATSASVHPSVDDDRTGSTFVPMDSWVYPTLERLAAMGLVPSQSVAIRPWTRQECRRQVREAKEILYGFDALDYDLDRDTHTEAERLLPELEHELREPDGRATGVLESVYVREGAIVGPALTDSFHFGQTWRNDYGRPLGQGNSVLTGYSARAVAGRFFLYSRQELQTDPGLPPVSAARAALFNQLDNGPFVYSLAPVIPPAIVPQPAPALAAYVRQRPLDLYAGIAFAGASLSFGKQELYWGPTTAGPWSFSSNAEPTYNLRLVATRPHPLPFFPSLGSYRYDLVIGKLSGHKYPARPYFNGQKFELTLGRYLDLSATRWSVLWGVGHPSRCAA